MPILRRRGWSQRMSNVHLSVRRGLVFGAMMMKVMGMHHKVMLLLGFWDLMDGRIKGVQEVVYLIFLTCQSSYVSTYSLPPTLYLSLSQGLAKTPMRSALAGLGSLQKLIWRYALWNPSISTISAIMKRITMLETVLILKGSGGFCKDLLAAVVATCPSQCYGGAVRVFGPFQRSVKMQCCGHYNVVLDAKTTWAIEGLMLQVKSKSCSVWSKEHVLKLFCMFYVRLFPNLPFDIFWQGIIFAVTLGWNSWGWANSGSFGRSASLEELMKEHWTKVSWLKFMFWHCWFLHCGVFSYFCFVVKCCKFNVEEPQLMKQSRLHQPWPSSCTCTGQQLNQWLPSFWFGEIIISVLVWFSFQYFSTSSVNFFQLLRLCSFSGATLGSSLLKRPQGPNRMKLSEKNSSVDWWIDNFLGQVNRFWWMATLSDCRWGSYRQEMWQRYIWCL